MLHPTTKMELVNNMLSKTDDEHLQKMNPMSSYHRHVLSSILPDLEQIYSCLQEKNNILEKENQALRKKVELLMNDSERLKEEHLKVQSVLKNRELLGIQLVHSRNEVQVLGWKLSAQNKDLKWKRNQNELLREEVESLKKALQTAKQKAVSQRAEQQKLKNQLEQVVKESDQLSKKWLHCYSKCSELSDRITAQQSSLNKKDNQYKEQIKQIHNLKTENQKLERERRFFENEANGVKCRLQRCEEELRMQREQLTECTGSCFFETQIVERTVIPKQKRPLIRKPTREVPAQKVESLQKELCSQNQELKRTQTLCEELRQSLTQTSVQLQQCKATLRDRKEKLKALTAERDVYRQKAEKLQKEWEVHRKEKLSEKLKKWATKNVKQVQPLCGGQPDQSYFSLSKSYHQRLCSKAQMEPGYMIIGSKI